MEEEGEEEGEEEEEDSGAFDAVSKMNVPNNMKRLVKYKSGQSSNRQTSNNDGEKEQSHGDKTFSKPFSIKSLSNASIKLSKEANAQLRKVALKRKTESKKYNKTMKTVTKSDMKKMQIRPLPKSLSKPNFSLLKKKEPEVVSSEPKEDSFFKDFDASKLDFSKYNDKSNNNSINNKSMDTSSKILDISNTNVHIVNNT